MDYPKEFSNFIQDASEQTPCKKTRQNENRIVLLPTIPIERTNDDHQRNQGKTLTSIQPQPKIRSSSIFITRDSERIEPPGKIHVDSDRRFAPWTIDGWKWSDTNNKPQHQFWTVQQTGRSDQWSKSCNHAATYIQIGPEPTLQDQTDINFRLIQQAESNFQTAWEKQSKILRSELPALISQMRTIRQISRRILRLTFGSVY